MDQKILQAIEDSVTRAVERVVATPKKEDRLLDAWGVADRLGISRSMAFKLFNQNEIPTVRVGKAVRAKDSDVDKYIERISNEVA
jgi:excisionase family DNA binding protein